MSQNLTLESLAAERRQCVFFMKRTAVNGQVCANIDFMQFPKSSAHIFISLSTDPVASILLSEAIEKSVMGSLCPYKERKSLCESWYRILMVLSASITARYLPSGVSSTLRISSPIQISLSSWILICSSIFTSFHIFMTLLPQPMIFTPFSSSPTDNPPFFRVHQIQSMVSLVLTETTRIALEPASETTSTRKEVLGMKVAESTKECWSCRTSFQAKMQTKSQAEVLARRQLVQSCNCRKELAGILMELPQRSVIQFFSTTFSEGLKPIAFGWLLKWVVCLQLTYTVATQSELACCFYLALFASLFAFLRCQFASRILQVQMARSAVSKQRRPLWIVIWLTFEQDSRLTACTTYNLQLSVSLQTLRSFLALAMNIKCQEWSIANIAPSLHSLFSMSSPVRLSFHTFTNPSLPELIITQSASSSGRMKSALRTGAL